MSEPQEPFVGEDGLPITAVHEPYPRDRFLACIPYTEMAKLLTDEKTAGVLGFPVMYATDEMGKVYVWPTPSGSLSPWRPIATAPKDGTRILVCRPPQWTPRQIIVSWGEIVGGFGWIPWGASDTDFLGWMPIPPPPEAT